MSQQIYEIAQSLRNTRKPVASLSDFVNSNPKIQRIDLDDSQTFSQNSFNSQKEDFFKRKSTSYNASPIEVSPNLPSPRSIENNKQSMFEKQMILSKFEGKYQLFT